MSCPATVGNGMGGPYPLYWLPMPTLLCGRMLHLSPSGIPSRHLNIGGLAATAERKGVLTATVAFAPTDDVDDAMQLRLQGLGNARCASARPTSVLARRLWPRLVVLRPASAHKPVPLLRLAGLGQPAASRPLSPSWRELTLWASCPPDASWDRSSSSSLVRYASSTCPTVDCLAARSTDSSGMADILRRSS